MREEQGDLWQLPADARCVTTNGTVRNDGHAVMGRGCAREAVKRFGPQLSKKLGFALTAMGNHVHVFGEVVTFPVKTEWHLPADIDLIAQSCKELMHRVEERGWQRVLLPRPGCGNGQLAWEDVRPVIEPLLDDRVVVVSP